MARADRLVGMAKKLSGQLSRVPGAGIIQQEYEAIEDALLQELHQRMFRALAHDKEKKQQALPTSRNSEGEYDVDFDVFGAPTNAPARMTQLLAEALTQRPEEALLVWVNRTLDQLTPDEARIIGAMSDGGTHPTVQAQGAPSLTGAVQPLSGYVCSVGKTAKIKARDLTGAYIQQLLHLGLVEVVNEDSAHELDYQVLEVDSLILSAISRAKLDGYHRVRCHRRAIQLSELGRKFWAACQTTEQIELKEH